MILRAIERLIGMTINQIRILWAMFYQQLLLAGIILLAVYLIMPPVFDAFVGWLGTTFPITEFLRSILPDFLQKIVPWELVP